MSLEREAGGVIDLRDMCKLVCQSVRKLFSSCVQLACCMSGRPSAATDARWFGRASRGLGVPLTVACGLAAFPRSVRCTRAQSAGASQQRASRSEQALERERYTQLREGCRKSRRGRRSTVIDELAAAAARFAAQRAWCRAQQSNPLHPQGWHAWMWPLTSCSSCAVDVSH